MYLVKSSSLLFYLFCVLFEYMFMSAESSVIFPFSHSIISRITPWGTPLTNDIFDRFFSSSSSSSLSSRPISVDMKTSDHYDLSTYTEPGDENAVMYDMNNRASYQTAFVTVNISATEFVTVYLNGQIVGRVRDWRKYGHFKMFVGSGDVLGIVAFNHQGWHGVIVDVRMTYPNNTYKQYYTGDDEFRIRKSPPGSGHSEWKLPSSLEGCGDKNGWRKPVAVVRPIDDRFSKEFPYRRNLKYVWYPHEANPGHVQLRVVFGGQNCERPTSTTETGIEQCSCKEIPIVNDNAGECYEFTSTESYKTFYLAKRCTTRDCAPRFECVDSSSENSTVCLKHYSYAAVRPILPLSLGKCKQERLHPPTTFYAPYS